MRQMGLGIEIYANENQGYHPPRYHNDTAGFPDVILASLRVAPYAYSEGYVSGTPPYPGMRYYHRNGASTVLHWRNLPLERKVKTLFHCPGELLAGQGGAELSGGSYASNWELMRPGITSAGPYYGRQLFNTDKRTGVPQPANTMSAACSAGRMVGGNREYYVGQQYGYNLGWTAARRADGAYFKHLGASNGLFLDGHARAIQPNPVQPVSWDTYDLEYFKLIDIKIITYPTLGAPRLHPTYNSITP
jgi:prepilin-type processing-associated H-X9-DG protein